MKTLSTALLAGLLAVNASAFGPPCLPMPCPEKQVQCTIKVITVREKACKELKLTNCERFCTPEMTTNLLQSLKGCPTVEFLSAPRMTMLSGQQGHFSVVQMQQACTGVTIDCLPNGTLNNVPKIQPIEVGLVVECLPIVTADGKIVLSYTATRKLLDETVLQPVTTMLTPVFEGGSQGEPVPFTTFLQPAIAKSLSKSEAVKLADGSSLWTCLGSRPCTCTVETKIPILGDLPILGELFQDCDTLADTEYTFVLMTVKVVTVVDQLQIDRPATCCPPALATNVPYITQLFPCPAQCPTPACPLQAVQPCPVPLMLPSAFAATPVMPPQVYASSPQLVPAATVVPVSGCMPPCCPVTAALQSTPCCPVTFSTPLTPCCPVVTATPPAKNDTVLKVLLEQYDVACKAGDTTKAKTIAAFCLEMDPACFSKK